MYGKKNVEKQESTTGTHPNTRNGPDATNWVLKGFMKHLQIWPWLNTWFVFIRALGNLQKHDDFESDSQRAIGASDTQGRNLKSSRIQSQGWVTNSSLVVHYFIFHLSISRESTIFHVLCSCHIAYNKAATAATAAIVIAAPIEVEPAPDSVEASA